MQEQENSSLWQDSPHQDSGPYGGTPKENIFAGNGISQFMDPESPLSIGLQTAPLWRPRFLIAVINANDRISRVKPVKPRSNLGQPGSSPENLANEL
jgi:hypothetical protein